MRDYSINVSIKFNLYRRRRRTTRPSIRNNARRTNVASQYWTLTDIFIYNMSVYSLPNKTMTNPLRRRTNGRTDGFLVIIISRKDCQCVCPDGAWVAARLINDFTRLTRKHTHARPDENQLPTSPPPPSPSINLETRFLVCLLCILFWWEILSPIVVVVVVVDAPTCVLSGYCFYFQCPGD